MFQCPVTDPGLRTLFDLEVPNSPALWAVLSGRHTGQALVDDRRSPSQCVLRTDACLTYFSRHSEQAFLDEALSNLRKWAPVWLVWPAEATLRRPAADDAQIEPRIEFYDCDPDSVVLAKWRRRLPPGFAIRPTDRPLLERCRWRDEMAFYCGSLANFLANGIGLCLTRGADIVVEAYASALGGSRAEIGAITLEAFRGRNYAPIACAYLIQACARVGYQAYWSCDEENVASIKVARKLGFGQGRAYQTLVYAPEPEAIGRGSKWNLQITDE